MSIIVINNVKLELDLLDAEQMEKYEIALNKAVVDINASHDVSAANGGGNAAESMKAQCQIVENFVDDVFGHGTAQKIFPRKHHLGDHLDAFGQICIEGNKAVQKTRSILNKYSAGRLPNREERRKHGKMNRQTGRFTDASVPQ